MPHFKDSSGALHFLDDAQFVHLLPAASKQLTQAEEAAHAATQTAAPTPTEVAAARKAQIQADLQSIDERKVRALTDALLHGDMTRLETLETQAAALRSELVTLSP
jgi:predicted component of type VI protein secretion system